jgi:malonyl-CoA/methylmalonyl-CoA synthetase
MESAVIGIPDPDYGEQVIAVIVPASPVDDESSLIESLAALCAGELAGFKRPKRFRLVNELPRNAMGKVQKTELRKQQLEMLA